MPEGSYPFPMYSGLLEPEHYKKIGSAIWLFLWCISSTTAEQEREGIVWGVVLGNKPMKLSEIAEKFAVNDKTVSRWLDTLESHQYIKVTRAPRGLILAVRNSKKWSDKNVRSLKNEETYLSDHSTSEQTKMSDQSPSDKTVMSDHSLFSDSDQTNMSDLKDIKDLITITTIASDMEFGEEHPPDHRNLALVELLRAYCEMHGKLDVHVTVHEREAMGRVVAGGTPNPFTIRTMASLLEAKRQREGARFKLPKSFLYYVDGIEEAWHNYQAIRSPSPKTGLQQPRTMSRHQRELEDLRRRAREVRNRE